MRARSKLLVVSNRGPLNFGRDESGAVVARRGAGGLVVTLGPGAERHGAVWLAVATGELDREAASHGGVTSGDLRYEPVVVEPVDYAAYYDVVANQTLWFCLHGLWDRPRRPRFDRHWWQAWERFRAVNETIANACAESAEDGAAVLVQDYHLALVPGLLADARPDLRISSFCHTPWCSPLEMATLPDEAAAAIVRGLATGGPCGFHTARWANLFEECAEAFGYSARTFVAPAATDLDDLKSVAGSDECRQQLGRLEEQAGGRRVIARVDRMEPSKNVLRGFWAFDELLQQRPDLRGEVVFAAMIYPSRTGLAEYQSYSQEALSLATRINDKWASGDWTPILLEPEDNHPRSVATLLRYDVLLVNPVRDGLNLVAKEGPAVNQRDGVLVLSHQAGAFEELGEHALAVNPFDVSATAAALGRALDMEPGERRARSDGLRKAATARSPVDWFEDLLSSVS